MSLLEVFGGPLGSFGVSLAPSSDSFGCLRVAWAVSGLSLVLFCDTGPQGVGALSSTLNVLCVFCGHVSVFSRFSFVF